MTYVLHNLHLLDHLHKLHHLHDEKSNSGDFIFVGGCMDGGFNLGNVISHDRPGSREASASKNSVTLKLLPGGRSWLV